MKNLNRTHAKSIEKRVLVRLINHSLGVDKHQMQMVGPNQIKATTTQMLKGLAQEANCPVKLSANDLIAASCAYDNVIHAAIRNDNWLVQLRIDNKQMESETLQDEPEFHTWKDIFMLAYKKLFPIRLKKEKASKPKSDAANTFEPLIDWYDDLWFLAIVIIAGAIFVATTR